MTYCNASHAKLATAVTRQQNPQLETQMKNLSDESDGEQRLSMEIEQELGTGFRGCKKAKTSQ